MLHRYVDPETRVSQILRALKIVGHSYSEPKQSAFSYLEPENVGLHLFIDRKNWVRAMWIAIKSVTSIWNLKILGYSYLEHKKLGHSYLKMKIVSQLFISEQTGSQLFGSRNSVTHLFRSRKY